MSTNNINNVVVFGFAEVWDRVNEHTGIKSQNELSKVIGITQAAISSRKQKGNWPEEWAYRIGRKYNLLTEWILTGEGPKNLDNTVDKSHFENSILDEIDEWLSGLVADDKGNRSWFRIEFQNKFAMFAQWKKRRDNEESRNNSSQDSKVA